MLRWGVLAPTFCIFGTRRPPLVESCRLAEDLGFDALWVGDHLLGPAPVLDSLCALSAAAAVTQRIELGVSVLQLGLRHLVWTAKQLATIALLAPGRLRLGVGVGGEFPEEFVAAGVPRASRGRRLDEMLELLPHLLGGEAVDHDGPHVRVRVVDGLRPALTELPRISVGGRSDAALERAARYGDQWIGMWHDAETVRRSVERLAKLAAAEGRRPPGVAMLVLFNIDEDLEAARTEVAAALDAQYRLPLRVVDRWSAYGPPARVAELLSSYAQAGAGELLLLPAAAKPLVQLERLLAVRELVERG